MNSSNKGFTLVELMVALAVSGFLMAGVSFVYIALSQSINTTKELENAQEVLRYSSEVFTRSLKQTTVLPTITDSTTLAVEQATPGIIACDGSEPTTSPFTETFTFSQNQLWCQVDTGTAQVILTGLTYIDYRLNGDLVEITITPENLNVDMISNGFRLDIALTGKILTEALN
jgi:prepilin-type N-terminal cleavage/methylation domain-containing protein